MPSPRPRFADLRILGEVIAIVVVTWLMLGWTFQRAITQMDGSVLVVPFTQSALHAGADWTNHLYRFGVLGGSEMHAFAGSLPIVQICAALGLSATTTVNIVTVVIQVCLAVFAIASVEAISERRTTPAFRIAIVWLAAFAPVVGWRLGIGHENLLLGLLPLVAAMTLVWTTRAGTLSPTLIAVVVVAVFDGVSGLGPQMVAYGAVFGAPFVIASIVAAPRGTRWGRMQWLALVVLIGSALLAIPRVMPMFAHAIGDDATRGLGDSVVYSYGGQTLADWAGSLAWTTAFAERAGLHERNYPIGPLVVLVVALWPKGRSRRALWALVGAAVVAIMLADDIEPIATALVRLVPPLESFRVPARAMMPIVIFVPTLAAAAIWQQPPSSDRRLAWIGVLTGAIAIAFVRSRLPYIREVIAWGACVAIVVPRLRTYAVPTLGVIAALGVCAFDERFPRELPSDPVEDGPHQLHDAVLTQLPDLALPLDRIELVDTKSPYAMSTAFAAELPSLDGVWYPPRRFLDLLTAITGSPTPSTTCVFNLGRSRAFPVLQQLYNVRYRMSVRDLVVEHLPATPGAAWFPAHVATVDTPGEMMRALSDHDLRSVLVDTAWQLRRDDGPSVAGCATARVNGVRADDLGQTATIDVSSPSACTLVVATNYISSFRATADGRETDVFPIDVARTCITVPAGTATIELAPEVTISWWAWLASVAGITLVLGACGLLVRAKRA